jgi:hypothetical protein
MAKKAAPRALAAADNVLGACVVTDPRNGAQTTRCGTKDQCDNWGGVFLGPPCGLGAAPEKAAVKKAKKKSATKKGGGKK